MIYVFDTSSIRSLQHFYPKVFKTIWESLDEMVTSGNIISTREVHAELKNQSVSKEVLEWAEYNKHIFLIPESNETQFVAQIFRVTQFQALISKQASLRGTPVADPFVIACANAKNATVVTEEGWLHSSNSLTPKPNAAKIPNVCSHFGIPCLNLETFMEKENWTF